MAEQLPPWFTGPGIYAGWQGRRIVRFQAHNASAWVKHRTVAWRLSGVRLVEPELPLNTNGPEGPKAGYASEGGATAPGSEQSALVDKVVRWWRDRS